MTASENSLNGNLEINTELGYDSFKEIVLNLLPSNTQKMFWANQRIFINKVIHKAIMIRSMLRMKLAKDSHREKLVL